MSAFRYRLYGLNLASDLELPELPPAHGGATDVAVVVRPDAPPTGEDVLAVDEVATFRVPDRNQIEVAVHPASQPAQVRLFLLGSAMAMLLYRRGMLPLHANAVVVDGEAWAFLGESGAGKSTLAAWMRGKGYPLLADDVCAIDDRGGGDRVMAFRGVPRLRLWEDAVLREGLSPVDLPLTWPGDEDYRKFDVALVGDRLVDVAPLGLLCLLETDSEMNVERLQGLPAVEALYAHSYRGHHVTALGHPERHWELCLRLACDIPVFRYCRTMVAERMAEENEAAIEWLAGELSRSAG